MRPIPVSSVSSTPFSSGPSARPSRDAHLPAPGVPARLALALIRAYKLVLSPWFTGACRFMPTCADYTAEAIARHGLVRGSWLGAGRLARCHPFARPGHDPVPTSFAAGHTSAGPLAGGASFDSSGGNTGPTRTTSLRSH